MIPGQSVLDDETRGYIGAVRLYGVFVRCSGGEMLHRSDVSGVLKVRRPKPCSWALASSEVSARTGVVLNGVPVGHLQQFRPCRRRRGISGGSARPNGEASLKVAHLFRRLRAREETRATLCISSRPYATQPVDFPCIYPDRRARNPRGTGKKPKRNREQLRFLCDCAGCAAVALRLIGAPAPGLVMTSVPRASGRVARWGAIAVSAHGVGGAGEGRNLRRVVLGAGLISARWTDALGNGASASPIWPAPTRARGNRGKRTSATDLSRVRH